MIRFLDVRVDVVYSIVHDAFVNGCVGSEDGAGLRHKWSHQTTAIGLLFCFVFGPGNREEGFPKRLIKTNSKNRILLDCCRTATAVRQYFKTLRREMECQDELLQSRI
ncbi:Uncharacterized protein APZ42_032475 [Daphnia magna]|uniref:Uncharacterized protein n=1 Tax=Daphnia magna TaxID=35525 RepID=A0A162D8G9_9CRUS|nr:Uncharacterized protein APZ42_032475 [Daphnia magna]